MLLLINQLIDVIRKYWPVIAAIGSDIDGKKFVYKKKRRERDDKSR